MKNALNDIKQLPNVTAKEAAEMRKVLKKEFKEAEQAAKRAEVAQTKAMKKTAIEAKKAAGEMRKLKRESAQLGSAVQASGDLISELNPELAGLASTATIAGLAIRDLGKVFLTGNPLILGAVVAIGAAVVAYQHFTEETRRFEAAQGSVTTAIENANVAIRLQQESALNAANALSDARAQVADLEFEYKLLTGQVTQYDAEIRRAQKTQEKATQALTQAGAEQDAANKNAIKQQQILVRQTKQYIEELERQGKQEANNGKGTDGYIQAKRTLARAEIDLIELQNKRLDDAEAFAEQSAVELVNMEEVLKATAEAREADRKRREAQKRASEQRAKDAKDEAQRKRDQAKSDAEFAKLEEERIKKIESIYDQADRARESAFDIQNQNRLMQIQMIDNEILKLDELNKFEQEQIQNRIQALQNQQLANEANIESVEQEIAVREANKRLEEEINALKDQQHVLDMENSKERLEAMDKEQKKRIQNAFAIADTYVQSADAISNLISTASKEDQKAAMVAFRISQASAIANIAMSTAQKIMEVAPNPFAIAGISALGAIQAATVLAQSPPEKHMGGFISKGEDTRNVTVLTGEAVLDRRTVERLGGERGINELQRTGEVQQPQVVVMNPFKHFDRYAKASIKRGGALSSINRTSSAGSY